jgi:hypothetical protein
MEEEGRRRAREAAERAAERKRRKRAEDKAGSGTAAEEGAAGFEFRIPPPEFFATAIRNGIKALREGIAADLEARRTAPGQDEELAAFRARCVVGDVELFCLATGAEALAHKYQAWIGRWAPEVLTAAGVLFLLSNQLRLRREAKAIAERWKTARPSTSSSAREGPENRPS